MPIFPTKYQLNVLRQNKNCDLQFRVYSFTLRHDMSSISSSAHIQTAIQLLIYAFQHIFCNYRSGRRWQCQESQ